uniref:Uncharacterized protein n=1 Tax=Xiphophorus couchianus TaxID=32473 RepID=A0A3B5M442_9TELE
SDNRQTCRTYRSGVALLCSGESGDSFDVCLRLSRDALTIQKLDVVCTDGHLISSHSVVDLFQCAKTNHTITCLVVSVVFYLLTSVRQPFCF